MIRLFPTLIVATICLLGGVSADDALVAHWAFDDGAGDIVKDSAGKSDGKILGAQWIRVGKGFALSFDGADDYIDCGDTPSLDLHDAITIEAWVKPDAPPLREPGILGKSFDSYLMTYYQSGSSYFYVNEGGNGAEGPIKVGAWSHIAASFDGKTIRFYVNGVERGSRDSKFAKIAKGGRFFIGVVPADPRDAENSIAKSDHFRGALDDIRVYKVARSARQIAESFNEGAADKGLPAISESDLAELTAEVFPYPERKTYVVATSFARMQGLGDDVTVRCEIVQADGSVIDSQEQQVKPPLREAEFTISAEKVKSDNITAVVAVTSGGTTRQAKATLPIADETPALPSPSEQIAAHLPAAIRPAIYQLEVTDRGAMVVHIGERKFPIESTFSYPDGGENTLAADAAPTSEKEFVPAVKQLDSHTWKVEAKGAHYQLTRTIKATTTRIEISDAFTNLTQDAIGIIYSNGIDTRKLADASLSIMPNPTVFAASGNSGLGMVALDDVYQIHQQTRSDSGFAKIIDEHLGIDVGKSYTVEWALYPTASADYFDFINQLRKDEGLNGHVEGSVELTSRWGAPPADQVAYKGLKYVSSCYLTHSLQNPHRSLEGWEFVEFPELCDRITTAIADTRSKFPNVKPMFHVAHSLYFTNQPVEKFGDSVVRDQNGNLDYYGPNTIDYYGKYVAKELFDANWRWYLIYPTSTNSFGKHTLHAVDVMIDQLKAGAIWADGFFTAYVKGGYTFDTWDGHSVMIDPKTKRVTRKMASPTLIGRDVLLEIVRRFEKSGGVLISNDKPGPRSFWREKMITSNETGGGDQQPIAGLYLGQTVTPLGNPGAFNTARSLYRDVLAKLDAGALYFFYGEGDLVKEKTIVSCMYPITFESIHPGVVRGRERIVTRKSGSYGWSGDSSLHAIDLADARGSLRPNPFFTTIEVDSVRSQLDLKREEMAVVQKIPATLTGIGVINCRVIQYGSDGLQMLVSSSKPMRLDLQDGEFAVQPDGNYSVEINGVKSPITSNQGRLSVDIPAGSKTTMSIRRSEPKP